MTETGVLLMASSLRFGGAEKHTVTLANQLNPSMFRVEVCHIKPDAQLVADLLPEHREHVTSLDVQGKFEWQAVHRLVKLIEERDINLVLCTNGYPVLYAMLAARKVRRPLR